MARTVPSVSVSGRGDRITGASVIVVAALTNSEATTAAIAMSGTPFGRVYNHSGSSITITFYDAMTATGEACATYDENGTAVQTLTVPDNGSAQLPSALAACTYLLPVLSSGTATVYIKLER